MWGGSYAGYNQWAAAKEMPPHLATIVPVASPCMSVDFPIRNNMLGCYVMQWLTYISGRTGQDKIFWNSPLFWKRAFARWYESGAPFAQLDTQLGNPSVTFQEWISHPEPDEYWDRYNPTAEDYEKLRLPILTITGSYDADQPGALTHYREHVKNAPEGVCERHYLVIGPWDHAGTRIPRREFDGVKVGPESLVDLGKLHLEWYAWTMQGGPKPEFLRKRVAYYVMGADRWRYADTLETVTDRIEPYYLGASCNPTDLFHSGSLGPETPRKAAPSHYVYDPRDVNGARFEVTIDTSYTDQRLLHHWHGRRLFFHSAPFERDTELTGFFKLRAWLAIDQPDTDFEVMIYETGVDGSSLWLTSDSMRARYRESLRRATLVRTTEPLLYEFDRFTFTSRVIKRGSRLRLVIGPADSIHLQRNFNSGGVVAQESMRDARPVRVQLFHDPEHPSALYLPIGRPYSKDEPSAPASCLLLAGQSAAGEGIYA
jgi:putative CocE/NonD family hydrolase